MSPSADVAAAIALAGLPGMGPRRLTALLDAWCPSEAWHRATSGRLDRLVNPGGASIFDGTTTDPTPTLRHWQAAAAAVVPADLLEAHRAAGVAVLLRHQPGYPDVLRHDVEPPAVVFALGSLDVLDHPRAAVVGTRRCTGVGAGFARELGADLARAGVTVVSGLALGVDGAAHRGVLDAASAGSVTPPVGVVGSGLDVPYPSRHRSLWQAVAGAGLLLSEAPLGARPAPWRFPARNRIIAGLSDVVVVVESHHQGGSLHTVAEAERRDIPVLAAPGSVRNPAAAGTNQLLADGCHPVRDVTDVLVALGLHAAAAGRGQPERRPPPTDVGQRVLDAFGWEPATLEHLAVRTALDLPTLAVTVEELVAAGWVAVEGGWFERVATG